MIKILRITLKKRPKAKTLKKSEMVPKMTKAIPIISIQKSFETTNEKR